MPIIKLAGVLIKSLSKPISTYVKGHLKDNPTFASVMTKIGQGYQKSVNFISSTTEQISDDTAITVGAEFTVEFIFFAITGGLVVYDHLKAKQKMAIINQRIEILESKINI
jgi:hypothetical protein